MTFEESKTYLETFLNHELSLDSSFSSSYHLNRIKYLLLLLNNPEKSLKVIHVAGTKGKGSTCAMVASILQESGYTVGLYTSPHLNDFRERIRILTKNSGKDKPHTTDIFGDIISKKDFCKILKDIKPQIERARQPQELGVLSYFEVMTALALYYFHKAKVDFVVLETGLGGRLDATNVVSSLVAAITPISLEHTQLLGNTVEQIAAEKSAIIKDSKQNVVIASQDKKALAVVERRCRLFQIKPVIVGQDITYKEVRKDSARQTFHVKTQTKHYKNLTLRLLGEHQLGNASVAIGIVEALENLGVVVSKEAVYEGLKNIFWPGRFEIFKIGKATIVLDCAHNPASMEVAVKTIQDAFPRRKVTVILGLSKDKDKASICRVLHKIADRVIVTKAKHPRAYDFSDSELKEYFPQKTCYISFCIKDALALAFKETSRRGIIFVTGSVFVVSEARTLCMNLKK
ncbi:MAG: bifunctional folylpolyglutamate synthase/dihydrofolate synthase [Candidatus Omnitrophica bacterium]|nr:bifunctional folylpolyglutamate synthase/dihydrofolate synthase [Candidatus Omnitrophota bacterium]